MDAVRIIQMQLQIQADGLHAKGNNLGANALIEQADKLGHVIVTLERVIAFQSAIKDMLSL